MEYIQQMLVKPLLWPGTENEILSVCLSRSPFLFPPSLSISESLLTIPTSADELGETPP